MQDAFSKTVCAQEDWQERGWRFRLYAPPIGRSEEIATSQLLRLMKFHIRSRVISIIDQTETLEKGFAIGTARSGEIRIQIYWWTSECDLHRESVFRREQGWCWERLPSWEIGDLNEIAIINFEVGEFLQKHLRGGTT